MTTLIIARHGNTFEADETPRRVGVRTDLPLTATGREQARAIGRWLKQAGNMPDAVFCSLLRRTEETAALAMTEAGRALHIQRDAMFNEIDYGPDENKTDHEVAARIGAQALKDWDDRAIVPPGWDVHPERIIGCWMDFGSRIRRDYPAGKILVVTSNGIARFAPYLTGDFAGFTTRYKIKIATGALCVMQNDDDGGGAGWRVEKWNINPLEFCRSGHG